MEQAALQSGCRYEVEFSQSGLASAWRSQGPLRDGPGQGGICWGLSLVWLQHEKSGGHGEFFQSIRAPKSTSLLTKATTLQSVVQRLSDGMECAAVACGLHATAPHQAHAGESPACRYFSIQDAADMQELAAWLGKALGYRSFLINTDRHSMAAHGSKAGALKFFDPNFGVVSSPFSRNLGDFFRRFFRMPRIADYWCSPVRELAVYKF